MHLYVPGNHSNEPPWHPGRNGTLKIRIWDGHQLRDFQKCAANSRVAQKPSLCRMGITKTALESLLLRLETFPRCLCGAETTPVHMRPSQPKSEVVTNWWNFQKPPQNQENMQLSCTKSVLTPKPCIRMARETTQMNRLDILVEMAPWKSKSEMVTNWQIFQKLTATPQNG